jgi:signal transduction histidine kinase
LDVTKIESQTLQLKKEQFNLNEVILQVLNNYGNQMETKKANNTNIKDVEIKLAVAPKDDIILVEGDRERLTQVVDNLIGNAFKFTAQGEITINLEKKKDKNTKEIVVVSIKDSGSGIEPNILPRLFTKFATKSETGTGTGLGLYISKRIIECHGGKIWAENNVADSGASFSFSLPLV